MLRSIMLASVAAGLALIMAPIAAVAATFTFDHQTVIMRGPIVQGDGASLDRFLSAGHNNGHPLTTLQLNSPGGLVREGMALADAVRQYHVNVTVPEDGLCASACFLLFAAGEHKEVGPGARIGIHSATSTGGVGQDDGNGTLLMARYAAQEGVPAAIVGQMVITDSVNVIWLNEPELRSMGAEVASTKAPGAFYAPLFNVNTGTKFKQQTDHSSNASASFFSPASGAKPWPWDPPKPE